jgi:hypothetical protein
MKFIIDKILGEKNNKKKTHDMTSTYRFISSLFSVSAAGLLVVGEPKFGI